MPGDRGFTLVELTITVGIIGVLAAIAIPKIGRLIDKANDATTKGNLGVLRSSLSIYYAENEGVYPGFIAPWSQPAGYDTLLLKTLVPRYIDKIPRATPSGGKHRASSRVLHVWNLAVNPEDPANDVGDGWIYDANRWDALKPAEVRGLWGTIRVLCTHTDSRGRLWQDQ